MRRPAESDPWAFTCRVPRHRRAVLAAASGGFVYASNVCQPRAWDAFAKSGVERLRTVPLIRGSDPPPVTAWSSRPVRIQDRGEIIEDTIDLTPVNGIRKRRKLLRVLRSLLTPEEADAIRNRFVVSELSGVELQRNAVKTPHQMLASDGEWCVDDPLAQLVQPFVTKRLIPYMQEEFDCPSLAASYVLVRRYMPDHRRNFMAHVDRDALGSAIIDLTPCEGSGLFVGSTASASSQFFVPFDSAGDVVVHAWNLVHGVRLRQDHNRISIVVWTKPRSDIEQSTSSWYASAARDGDMDALYRLGLDAEERGDTQLARRHLLDAAERGQPFAMLSLSTLLARLGDNQGAKSWMQRSADAGWCNAQVGLGDLLMQEEDAHGAIRMYEEAAAQGDGWAHHRLSAIFLHGFGVDEDRGRGVNHLREAAAAGEPSAQLALARLPELLDTKESRVWLQAAAAQGHPEAELLLRNEAEPEQSAIASQGLESAS